MVFTALEKRCVIICSALVLAFVGYQCYELTRVYMFAVKYEIESVEHRPLTEETFAVYANLPARDNYASGLQILPAEKRKIQNHMNEFHEIVIRGTLKNHHSYGVAHIVNDCTNARSVNVYHSAESFCERESCAPTVALAAGGEMDYEVHMIVKNDTIDYLPYSGAVVVPFADAGGLRYSGITVYGRQKQEKA